MEGGSVLDAIYEEDNFDNDDVEMVDVEEGELVVDHRDIKNDPTRPVVDGDGDAEVSKQEEQSKNRRRRANKKKNRKRKRVAPGSGPDFTDINRFVLDTCRRLKEKKSYMVYTAVGCLGVSALSDLVKEVDAIQACGGQMTADGKRQRTGGGVLWSIIKAREPNAYREIMKRAREFEKQFKPHNIQQGRQKEVPSDGPIKASPDRSSATTPDGFSTMPELHDVDQESAGEEKRQSVKERLRVPVSYEDILDDPEDGSG
ncbi:uncharacterized protein LOC115671067 [Syzygium oleosum]|uniref:uncharacterized protein LOC115671067 n=1 Tax=Syzygium oleosum TaxID=219896 RepID=UPI0011D28EFC|nr:uncharacterized protein LOC115671067 [Syzygium oleosum]